MDVPELLLKVNQVANPEALTDLEKKHVTAIQAPEAVKAGEPFQVTLHVGKLLAHPNEPDHHIEEVALYKGYVFLGRTVFTAALAEPLATFSVRLPAGMHDKDGVLRAYARCNKHGTWESCRNIRVD